MGVLPDGKLRGHGTVLNLIFEWGEGRLINDN